MSLILDALRKIELERKAKRQSSQEIRSEVLNYRGITPAAEKSRTVPMVAALLLVSAAGASFFYFTKTEPPKIDSPPQREALRREATPIIPPLPLQPPPAEPPAQKSVRREVKSPAAPVNQSTDTVTGKQENGEEGITVSGIAWQDERSLRRAVINGFLIGEGAEIQGAKIVEIKKSRVRFSRGGEFFEVVHTSGAGE
jgi:general secretion pathway protein B